MRQNQDQSDIRRIVLPLDGSATALRLYMVRAGRWQRRLLPILVSVMVLGAGCGRRAPGPEAVVVRSIRESLPGAERERPQFLWDRFVNKAEEEPFGSLASKDWSVLYAGFAESLAAKAAKQGLEAEPLRHALATVRSHAGESLAYVPVGAYRTSLNGKAVWIVVVKWAEPSADPNVGHTRVFAVDQQTGQQVGFVTCD